MVSSGRTEGAPRQRDKNNLFSDAGGARPPVTGCYELPHGSTPGFSLAEDCAFVLASDFPDAKLPNGQRSTATPAMASAHQVAGVHVNANASDMLFCCFTGPFILGASRIGTADTAFASTNSTDFLNALGG
jgi:hypothetical protein